jgi:putative acyl-CoA dehydrogenase
MLATLSEPERTARRTVERLATVWAASLMSRHRPGPGADAYLAGRIVGDSGAMFGTLPASVDHRGIAMSAVPVPSP